MQPDFLFGSSRAIKSSLRSSAVFCMIPFCRNTPNSIFLFASVGFMVVFSFLDALRARGDFWPFRTTFQNRQKQKWEFWGEGEVYAQSQARRLKSLDSQSHSQTRIHTSNLRNFENGGCFVPYMPPVSGGKEMIQSVLFRAVMKIPHEIWSMKFLKYFTSFPEIFQAWNFLPGDEQNPTNKKYFKSYFFCLLTEFVYNYFY